MTLDPHVDRQLAELWAISDHLAREVNESFAAKRQEIAVWQPAPCPPRKEYP